ncbi:hypothetical protein C8R44DRAFT_868641 [Mycena epipterygia]|nr:hypothetical protein C8R44DRAFT_868641 [Mycena epipterygia]
MGSQDRFPHEIWLEVFQNLPHYSFNTELREVSLTCRTFHRLSRPFLFTDFYFSPYTIDHFKEQVLVTPPTELERRREHLNFWCSAEIAPFNVSVADSPYVLLHALFDHLRVFTGLKRLYARHIPFTQAGIDNICRLPTLFDLEVRYCRLAPGARTNTSTKALRVSKFTVYYGCESEHGDDHWFPLLHPDHLRDLYAQFNPRFMRSTIQTFPHVHTLKAFMDFPTPYQNHLILSKFPAVRVLEIVSKTGWLLGSTRSEISSPFPLLEEYTGDYQNLPLFAPISNLIRLTTSFGLLGCLSCDPRDFITQLRKILRVSNITSLHVSFKNLDTMMFDTLLRTFPHLTEPRICIVLPSEDDMFEGEIYDAEDFDKDMIVDAMSWGCDGLRAGFEPTMFFLALADNHTLPPTLERVGLTWTCDERYTGQPSAYKVPDFPRLRDALVTRCPALDWLWLDGYYFLFQWRACTPDNGAREE